MLEGYRKITPCPGWRQRAGAVGLYAVTTLLSSCSTATPAAPPRLVLPGIDVLLGQGPGPLAGTCLYEGTNLSVGRGTAHAFQQIGAPWLDHGALVRRLGRYRLQGVRVDTVSFTPHNPGDAKYAGVTVRGIRFTTTDRGVYDPVRAALAALLEIRALHPDSLGFRVTHFDRLAGTDGVRIEVLRGATLEEIVAPWSAQLAAFRERRQPYLLYPENH